MNELIQSTSEKDDKLDISEKEKLEVIHESQETKSQLMLSQQKLTNLEASLTNKDNTLNMCQKGSEEKDIALIELKHALEKEQQEKMTIAGQYSVKLNDQTELNTTLQREIKLLKEEMDRQLETSTLVKNELEAEIKSAQDKCISLDGTRVELESARLAYEQESKESSDKIQSLKYQLETIADNSTQDSRSFAMEVQQLQEKCDTLTDERDRYEDACQKYETEISERIRENLHIMDDYDKSKVVEHKQLNFINELTKSNQDLNTQLRALQSEFEQVQDQLELTKAEVVKVQGHHDNALAYLVEEKKKSEVLQEDLGQRVNRITEQDKTSLNLQDEIQRLQNCLDATRQDLQEVTMEKGDLTEKYTKLEAAKVSNEEKAQREIESFAQRDEEQTSVLNKLVNDLEKTKHENVTKTEMVGKLKEELGDLYEKTQLESNDRFNTIQNLETQVFNREISFLFLNFLSYVP